MTRCSLLFCYEPRSPTEIGWGKQTRPGGVDFHSQTSNLARGGRVRAGFCSGREAGRQPTRVSFGEGSPGGFTDRSFRLILGPLVPRRRTSGASVSPLLHTPPFRVGFKEEPSQTGIKPSFPSEAPALAALRDRSVLRLNVLETGG